MSGFEVLGIPSSLATVDLTVFRISHLPTVIPAAPFIQPVLPGRDNLNATTYSYLISNKEKNKKVLFDLGPRKDLENLSPAARALLSQFEFNAAKDITELLHEAETPLDAINAVIFSHVHVDHVGDMSLFPSSTELVIGPGTVRDVYDPISNPNGTLLATDFANRTVTELDFTTSKMKIGGFTALDYFKDGSLYILDVPGHMPGHITALLRVQPTSFVFLSADTFHHAGQVRPTAALHKAVPISDELLSSAHDHISRDYFRSGGNDTTGFDFKTRSGPFFQIPELGFYSDPATSRTSQIGIEAFDANDDVFVVASHDSTIYPLTSEDKTTAFNDWKALGFKKQVTWQFVNTSSSAFRLSPA
ncbi:beta-lactamase-like protein [Flagelloscypha sp. PMI_526]|nr:beta-lactamase-like protein [Flagelloscypha sp. PMI_526]